MLVTCILTSHRKPAYCWEAVEGVLAQRHADWQLVVIDSGSLAYAGYFRRWTDPRITFTLSGETPGMRGKVCLQSRAINECFRRGLVKGQLVCYLSDDDVPDPMIFASWSLTAESHPEQMAWYGTADKCEVRRDGEVLLGLMPTVGPAGLGGVSLDCRVDGMQVCHRTAVAAPWPEDPSVASHADGVFMDALGKIVAIHPIEAKVGRHRHTYDSAFSRPSDAR